VRQKVVKTIVLQIRLKDDTETIQHAVGSTTRQWEVRSDGLSKCWTWNTWDISPNIAAMTFKYCSNT